MGAPPAAESSDLSEWPRSADDDAALSARKLTGTATGRARLNKHNRIFPDVAQFGRALALGVCRPIFASPEIVH